MLINFCQSEHDEAQSIPAPTSMTIHFLWVLEPSLETYAVRQ